MFIFVPGKSNILFEPMNPLVIWEGLRQLGICSDLRPRQWAASILERLLDGVSKILVGHH